MATVLTHKREVIRRPQLFAQLGSDGQTRKYGGVVDYIIAKYLYPDIAGVIITSPDEVLNPECHCGLVGRVLIWSSWSVGVEVMRSGVTIGNRWIFFTYKGGDQRSCDATRTEVFRVREDLPNLDYILGILSNWVVDATDPFEYFGKAAKTPDIEM